MQLWISRSNTTFIRVVSSCGPRFIAGRRIYALLSSTGGLGVQAQLRTSEDRARYDFTVAKLYAKMGFSDRSLEYLRKAMERRLQRLEGRL